MLIFVVEAVWCRVNCGCVRKVLLMLMMLQAYSTAQPVQFMFPGIPGLVPNGTFPSTAAIATSVPGAIKMEFPQNGYVCRE